MNQGEFGRYLAFVAGASLLLAIVNAIRRRFALAAACLTASAAMFLYRSQAGDAAVSLAALVAGVFFLLDLVARVRRQPGGAAKK